MIRFLVTGHGRSGTMWLAKLLNHCNPSIRVHHEPLAVFDRRLYQRVFSGVMSGAEFADLRRPKMEAIDSRIPNDDYAEVNSYLRYCAPAMREEFGVPTVAIRRNKADTVGSMMRRGLFERTGYPEIPAPDGLGQLEACGWYWEDTYTRLEADEVPVYELELLNEQYDYFVGLCEFLGCAANEAAWGAYIGKRVNRGR